MLPRLSLTILILHFICPKAYETGRQESRTEQVFSLKVVQQAPVKYQTYTRNSQTLLALRKKYPDEKHKYLGEMIKK